MNWLTRLRNWRYREWLKPGGAFYVPGPAKVSQFDKFAGQEAAIKLQQLGMNIMGKYGHHRTPATDVMLLALIDVLVRKGIITPDDPK